MGSIRTHYYLSGLTAGNFRKADYTESTLEFTANSPRPLGDFSMLSFCSCEFMRPTLLAALLFWGPAIAGNAQNERTPIETCGSLHTQAEMNDCAATEAKKADDALNLTYRDLLSKMKDNKTATQKVVAAEKAWIVFRDAELAAVWPVPEGENANLLYGSVHPLCYYNDLATMTWERVKTLKELMRDEEGDVCASGLAQVSRRGISHPCNSTVAKSD